MSDLTIMEFPTPRNGQNSRCDEHGDYPTYDEFSRPRRCPKCDARIRRSRHLKASGIPTRFWLRRFDNYVASTPSQQHALTVARGYANHFEERLNDGGGMILTGVPGTGKTHLAVAIVRHVIDVHGHSAGYTTAADFFAALKATYRPDATESYADVMKGHARAPLLVVDEIGVSHGTDYERNALYDLVNSRYAAYHPTILVSNLGRSDLAALIGQRVIDRMSEGGATIVFDWASYRSEATNNLSLAKGDKSRAAYDLDVKYAHSDGMI